MYAFVIKYEYDFIPIKLSIIIYRYRLHIPIKAVSLQRFYKKRQG